MTETINPNFVDLFDAATADFSNVDPRTSGFPVRPPEGSYPCMVKDIDAKPGKAKTKGGMDYETTEITFRFETLEPLPGETKTLEFIGRPFKLPKNKSIIREEGTQKYLEGEFARLCGHLSVILNTPRISNVIAALSQAKTLVCSKRTDVMVACQYEVDKKDTTKSYFKDFLTENLTAVGNPT